MGPAWGRFEVQLGSNYDPLGIQCGAVWDPIEVQLGLIWERFGVGLRSIRGLFGVGLYSILGKLGHACQKRHREETWSYVAVNKSIAKRGGPPATPDEGTETASGFWSQA